MTDESETAQWAKEPKKKKSSRLMMIMYIIAIIFALLVAEYMGWL